MKRRRYPQALYARRHRQRKAGRTLEPLISTQDPTVYAVPPPGFDAPVLLATAATDWRERWVLVTIVSKPYEWRYMGPAYNGQLGRIASRVARMVDVQVPGEKGPRRVALERFQVAHEVLS